MSHLLRSEVQHVAKVRHAPLSSDLEAGHDTKVAAVVTVIESESKAVSLLIRSERVSLEPLPRSEVLQLYDVAIKHWCLGRAK